MRRLMKMLFTTKSEMQAQISEMQAQIDVLTAERDRLNECYISFKGLSESLEKINSAQGTLIEQLHAQKQRQKTIIEALRTRWPEIEE